MTIWSWLKFYTGGAFPLRVKTFALLGIFIGIVMNNLAKKDCNSLDASVEIQKGKRFAFGQNWSHFLKTLDDERIAEAERSLQKMLDSESLEGKRFLDIGSGSGLFSLAARKLGARVESFDFDPQSVACTRYLQERHYPGDQGWIVRTGSILNADFLKTLEKADIVYSWGVLHHTGAMWEAIDNAAQLVEEDGKLFIALYNDQGAGSRRWALTKKIYNRNRLLRPVVLAGGFARLWLPAIMRDTLHGKPMNSWKKYMKESRGMSPWRDVVDWVGGWPFECATPGSVFNFLRIRGFTLSKLVTRPGHGCNEFVFIKG